MEQTHHRREEGFTFVELMFSTVIIVIAAAVLIGHLAMNYSATRKQRDRVFAFLAAKSMLDEVQALSEVMDSSGTSNIDALDDGATRNPTLSIATQLGVLIAPDHELSGNILRDGQWLWSRQITVTPFPGLNNRKLRYISVRVFKNDDHGKTHLIASLSQVVNSVAQGNTVTQVFDLYFIAIENIPGWWVHMESIRPFMEAVVSDLERNNPGMEIRSHWITKASYGRNPVYRPYINETIDSNQTTPYAYFLPGLMPSGSATTNYYVPTLIRGRMATDAGERNGYEALHNPYPYALADFFNHGMRYPRERAFHDGRVGEVTARKAAIAVALAASTTPPDELDDMSDEPTYRLLLEDMATDPQKYENALVVNLHGELIPMPSIRNYSDAAKDPVGLPGIRVVTHPEELRTRRPTTAGTETTDVKLRVYGYVTDPATYAGPTVIPDTRPIAIQVVDLDLTDGVGGLYAGVTIENLRGGVTVAGTTEYFPMGAAKPAGDPSLVADEMYYEISFVDPGAGEQKFTLIKLYNTPLVSPQVTDTVTFDERGLFANTRSRLYNIEYVPSCTEAGKDFSRDLYAAGDGPKNTARWVITVPGSLFAAARFVDTASPPTYFDPNGTGDPDRVLTVRTRIWDPGLTDPLESGTWPQGAETRVIQPENLSETYTWWAGSREAVPMTERSQFLGDARHNPYKDLWDGDPDFPNGYNWYFDKLDNNSQDSATDYPGLESGRLRDRWSGRLRQDVPRYFELIRTALVNSSAIYNTLAGYSNYYMGHGGEVGYDSNNGYPSSIPVDLTPLGTPGSDGFMDTITGARRYVRSPGGGYWWGMPWLGELCPDTHYASQWLALDGDGNVRGNLDAGTSANQFYQQRDQDAYQGSTRIAYGTDIDSAKQQTASNGCVAFFNIGSSGATFHHSSTSGTGNLVGPGLEIGNNYNVEPPASASITRPFDIAAAGSVGDEWNYAPYSTERYSANLLEVYYDFSGSGTGSGLVNLINPGATKAAYIVPTGLAQSSSSGTSVLAKYSLLSVLHSYFERGDPTRTFRATMTPRVTVSDPTEITEISDPVSIDITFDVDWKRWDGLPYTASMPVGFTENESDIDYVLMYSADNGLNWMFVQDDSLAIPGQRPASSFYVIADFSAGAETYTWSTPSLSIPAGAYLIRLEAYRTGQNLHYAYHQRKIYIAR